ncbi:TE: Transposable element Tcb1 Transposase, partial [Daphnia magna]
RVAAKKPLLRKQNVAKRLAFAKDHVNWTNEQWGQVLFSDESKFEIFGNKRRLFIRRFEGERYKKYCLQPTVKHGGGSIMVWGAISTKGALPLKRIEVKMDMKVYHQILIRHVLPGGKRLLGRGFTFQEDNDPKHASKLCRGYLDRKENAGEVIRMVWPPQSPDLNPIEQIWDHVDTKIRKMCNTSKNSLWVNLQTAWDDISINTFSKYINTMKSRCQAVIDAKGGHTRF